MRLRATDQKLLKRNSMTPLMLGFAVFCCVSGGPFGLEPVVQACGPGLALLLIVALPVLWALPDALTTAELASAIPTEGGYVVWVDRALGPFAAFVNAWWTWLYTLVDVAIYPVMFVEYLGNLWELIWGVNPIATNPVGRWALIVAMIAIFSALNIRGARSVGRVGVLLAVALMAPFVVMVVIGAAKLPAGIGSVSWGAIPGGGGIGSALAAGLGVAMWNYLGWDQMSTVAEEVESPQRAYPKAMLFGVAAVAAGYLLPTLIGLAFVPDPAQWTEGSWPSIAKAVGGHWLAVAVGLASLLSPMALFSAQMLASTRVPFVIASWGLGPKALTLLHPRFGTPWVAILMHSVLYCLLCIKSFQELVGLNVAMYGSALTLECVSLLVLRRREPNLVRPFRIPGGLGLLALILSLPIALMAILVGTSIAEEGWKAQLPTAIALISGPLLYLALRNRRNQHTPSIQYP